MLAARPFDLELDVEARPRPKESRIRLPRHTPEAMVSGWPSTDWRLPLSPPQVPKPRPAISPKPTRAEDRIQQLRMRSPRRSPGSDQSPPLRTFRQQR